MVERICSTCRADNALDARHCAECGNALDQALMKQPGGALALRVPALPARWQQAGKAVALGAVALAVEVGAAWLHQRAANKPAPLVLKGRTEPASRTTHGYVAQQRVWETYEGGEMTRRFVEQTVWRLGDE